MVPGENEIIKYSHTVQFSHSVIFFVCLFFSTLGLPSGINSLLVWTPFGKKVRCWWSIQDFHFVLTFFVFLFHSSSCQDKSAGHFNSSVQFSPFQLLSHVRLFVTLWTAARQVSLSITNSQSLLKLMSIELMMPPNHLILCHPFLFLPSIFPSIRVFSNESAGGQRMAVSASVSLHLMNI